MFGVHEPVTAAKSCVYMCRHEKECVNDCAALRVSTTAAIVLRKTEVCRAEGACRKAMKLDGGGGVGHRVKSLAACTLRAQHK